MEKSLEKPIYFLGIGGIGMASVAGLAKAAGFEVKGSDQNVYPPSSTMLQDFKIPVFSPYKAENIDSNSECLFVIGNSISRNHPELSEILQKELPYTSYPKFLSDYFLKNKTNFVVSGTHGKTTTTALLAFALQTLDEDPSYMIGGVPHDLERAFRFGKGPLFVLEGDEYDTAFFDKGSKFLHYRPSYVIVNNLEFDHADIFKDLEAIKSTFHKLLDLVPNPENVIVNMQDPGAKALIEERGWTQKISVGVSDRPLPNCRNIISSNPRYESSTQLWRTEFNTKRWGLLNLGTPLPGTYNSANISQVLASLDLLSEQNKIRSPSKNALEKIFSQFRGVTKRFDHLYSGNHIDVYLDFAHHPTAVKNVLTVLKTMHPNRRLIAAFEPKNASSRRNTFQEEYGQVLKIADAVLIAPPPQDLRIPEDQRLNIRNLKTSIGEQAENFTSFALLFDWLTHKLVHGDVVVFLSCGDFASLPRLLVDHLQTKNKK